jgi:hypothetical protein
MAINVLVANDDITVYGGPEVVELQLGVGEKGTRGSITHIGAVNPITETLGSAITNDLLVGDLYINAGTGEKNSYLYKYVKNGNTNQWVEVMHLGPTGLNSILLVDFTDGAGTKTIQQASVTGSSAVTLTRDDFVIRQSVEYTEPVSCSVSSVSTDGSNLTINFKAASFDMAAGTWSKLTADAVRVHVYISLDSVL